MQLIAETDPRLKQICEPFDFQSTTLEERQALVAEMTTVMQVSRGIGLAAPQVGINKQVFIMEIDDEIIACFNPEIVATSETQVQDQEGCLSFPLLFMKVGRSEWVEAMFHDVQGNEVVKKFDGLAARCYQHELDHVNGICFIDVVSPLVLGMAKKRRSKMRNKK